MTAPEALDLPLQHVVDANRETLGAGYRSRPASEHIEEQVALLDRILDAFPCR